LYADGVSLTPRFEKGPAEVLRALLSGDPEQVRAAQDFQRESFRARFGCYPEECEVVPYEDLTEEERRA
jgi:hypothetical protein